MAGHHEGRVAVVTGGTGSLGRAVVRELVTEGARVHVPRRGEARGIEQYLGDDFASVEFHEADLTSADSVDQLFQDIQRASGRVDILANIAGGFAFGPIEETDPATWFHLLNLNATTAFLCCRAVTPLMKANGWGRIVTVSSATSEDGAANMTAYSASKAALWNLTQSLAKELLPFGVTANAVVPTIIDTPANRKSMPDADTSTWLSPEEIAAAVGFLASEAADAVTGTAVNLSRG